MLISELIMKLEALKAAWGDVRVMVAPFSFSAEANAARERRKKCWWCGGRKPDLFTIRTPVPGAPNLSITRNRDDMSRDPEPMPWGYPGMGSVREDNPAREVTL